MWSDNDGNAWDLIQSMVRKGQFTPEKSRESNARRNELARQGLIKLGRPKGSIGAKKQQEIQTREAFIAAGQTLAGKLLNDLDKNSTEGDTRAALGILDRVGIIAVQKVEHEHKFSLVGLADARKVLGAPENTPIDGNPSMRIIETPLEVSDDEDE